MEKPYKIRDLLGNNSIKSLLSVLASEKCYTARELAAMIQYPAHIVTESLHTLMQAAIISRHCYNGHNYFRVISRETAAGLKAALAKMPICPIKPLYLSAPVKEIKTARTCYKHLAGELGVAITESMLQAAYIYEADSRFTVTAKGKHFFKELGLNIPLLMKNKQLHAPVCLDRTERRHHLAGKLGQVLLNKLFTDKWITRIPASRAVAITDAGKVNFKMYFGFTI